MSNSNGDNLKPSKLGTKEYWDEVYDQELQNWDELGEEGEIWFGEETVEKMVDWVLQNTPASQKPEILEIGTGNGTLLFALCEAGYDASLLAGIDSSVGSFKLATSIAASRSMDDIAFRQCDFLAASQPEPVARDLILDKGTFDAMALASGPSPALDYPRRVSKTLKPACNFTEEELKARFAEPATDLQYHSRLEHPVYTFGGRSGSVCSSIALRKPD